ncbi:tetratricopeptide repeat protein, partial [bacterium]|nr:tetratricopeptide repeat protein [bacterium]
MKKALLLLLALSFISTSVLAASSDDKSSKGNDDATSTAKEFYGEDTEAEWETDKMYYPNPNLNRALEKYKKGNYSGCLQEMISLTKIDSANPVVYYYMGMAYTQVGNKDQAVKAYEQVIKLQPEETLVKYATKGRDCLVGGPTCVAPSEEQTDKALDEFINSPYGNGFSDELNAEIRKKELENIHEDINKKPELNQKDIERIQRFDEKGEAPAEEKIASVSNEDVLAAIETLKKAGVTVSVNPYQQIPMNNEYAQLSMLLG